MLESRIESYYLDQDIKSKPNDQNTSCTPQIFLTQCLIEQSRLGIRTSSFVVGKSLSRHMHM